MLIPLTNDDQDNTEKYPLIVTFDQRRILLKRQGKDNKDITGLGWISIIATFLIIFGGFML
jgi:hypothetical protein